MSTANNHIDPLQTTLKDRFSNFEFDIDIDVNKVMETTNKATIASPEAGSQLKYWLGTGGIATGMVLLYFVFNNNVEKQNISSTKTVIINHNKPTVDEFKNESIIESNNAEYNKIEDQIIVEKQNSIAKPIVKSKKEDKPIEVNNSKIDESIELKSELKQDLPIENQPNIEANTESSFNDFIKKKSQENKDSIQLFKKKK